MTTYEGREPYIFISYAHKDSGAVLPIIEALQARGYRVWFDAGIEMGTEWPDFIADRLCDSTVVLAFITKAAVESHNCRREINFAIAEKKEMLVAFLEDFALPRGMKMQLGVLQAIFRTRFGSDAAFLDELCKAKVLQTCLAADTAAAPVTVTVPTLLFAQAQQYLQEKNYGTALPFLRQAAEAGLAAAQYRLGGCYFCGLGVPQDYAQAIPWYLAAAEQNDSYAMFDLGVCCENGFGCEKDLGRAVYWYKKAAEAGYADAQLHLGGLYEVGVGVESDYTQAAYWYSKAAAQSNPDAQNRLGWCYDNGMGCEQSAQLAVYWRRKAAEQGHTVAQYNLGYYYEHGYGVPQDRDQALYWYGLAAQSGDSDALDAILRLGAE